jgi:opacity protein-like surface antigen
MILVRPVRVMRIFSLFFSTVLGAAALCPIHAEDSQDRSSGSGFSLQKPRVFIGGHIGFNFPRANSDLFDMITRELTLKKSDFRAPTFGGDIGVPIGSNFATVFSFEYSRTTSDSESRNFVEDNGDAIAQTTRLTQVPVTATLRYYPRKAGETVGSYAWIPTRFNPYIGAGVGVVHYNFTQSGRFVDTQNFNIFSDTLKSSGFTDTEHIVGGIDISLSPRIFVNAEGRYSWASAGLSKDDFPGFHPIDLAGVRLLGGIYFRF